MSGRTGNVNSTRLSADKYSASVSPAVHPTTDNTKNNVYAAVITVVGTIPVKENSFSSDARNRNRKNAAPANTNCPSLPATANNVLRGDLR